MVLIVTGARYLKEDYSLWGNLLHTAKGTKNDYDFRDDNILISYLLVTHNRRPCAFFSMAKAALNIR